MPVSKPSELPENGDGRWLYTGFRSVQWGDDVLGRQRRDHQPPGLVQPDRPDVARGGAGEGLLQVLQGLVEFVLGLDQRLRIA
jgi:hypothetical protein